MIVTPLPAPMDQLPSATNHLTFAMQTGEACDGQ
jgi:hypothetical protein